MELWILLHSALLALQGIIIILLARHVARLVRKDIGVGAREMAYGPRKGEDLSSTLSTFFADEGVLLSEHKSILVVFSSLGCSICDRVKRDAEDVARHWRKEVEILFLYDEPCQAEHKNIQVFGESRGLRNSLLIPTIPYAVLLSPRYVVLAKGLVNSGSHVESLLESYLREHSQELIETVG